MNIEYKCMRCNKHFYITKSTVKQLIEAIEDMEDCFNNIGFSTNMTISQILSITVKCCENPKVERVFQAKGWL